MKFMLTGATGFIGGRLAQILCDLDHEVIAVVRNPEKAAGLSHMGVVVKQGDITDKDSLRKSMEGVDGIFHLAGWYKVGVRDRSQAKAINVDGTRNVLEVMEELQVPKGVYTSTLAVNSDTHGRLVDETYRFEGKHLSLYDQTKAEAHQVALHFQERGLPLVIVLPGIVYGPGDTSSIHTTFVHYLRRRLPVIPRQTAFCWSHVEDTALVHLKAMERGTPGETYITAGPVHTLEEALRLAEEITGIPAPLTGPPGMFKVLSFLARPFDNLLPLPEIYTSESIRVSAGVTYIGDNRKAKEHLGFKPRPLREGLKETLEYEMRLLERKP
ncbi:MAG: NAD-dependent epimerase/dehydratase family protein [Chloroflexi bacterium]|nr:MAG: NAD-dependent epimerase/dehydratase family protein [Chloroflexota bacterium]